jgi:hypothetical protein
VPADAVGESIQSALALSWVGRSSADVTLVRAVSADTELWGTDLTPIPGFVDVVTEHTHDDAGAGRRRPRSSARPRSRPMSR